MALQGAAQEWADYEDIPNSQIRRITAKRLLESKQTIPHYYLTIDCRVDKLVQLRSQLNESLAKDGKKLSINDFVIKASAQVGTRYSSSLAEQIPGHEQGADRHSSQIKKLCINGFIIRPPALR